MSQQELTRLEVIQRIKRKALKQHQAAELLSLSVRQVKRLCKAYQREGAAGMISKQRGRPSNHRLPEKTINQARQLLRSLDSLTRLRGSTQATTKSPACGPTSWLGSWANILTCRLSAQAKPGREQPGNRSSRPAAKPGSASALSPTACGRRHVCGRPRP